MSTKQLLEYYTTHPQDFDSMINLIEGTILKQASQIEELTAELARLTAHNESMQADAVNNTATINMLMAQLAERNKEVSQLKEKVRYAYVQIEALEAK